MPYSPPVSSPLPRAPDLLIAASLLLWGWQTETIFLAIIMALVLGVRHLFSFRFDFNARDFDRITDFTSVLLVIAILYYFYNYGSAGIFEILASLPLWLYPLIFTQTWSTEQTFHSSNLFISLRKLKQLDPYFADNRIDIGFPYFLVCLIAASEGNQYPEYFFSVSLFILVIMLWSMRSRRYQPVIWFGLLLVTAVAAWSTQQGLRTLQSYLEASYIDLFNQFYLNQRNPDRQTTAIGSIGRLKLSERIHYRLQTDTKLDTPLYLTEASYNYYAYGVWTNINQDELLIDPELDGRSWLLERTADSDKSVRITAYHKDEEPVLPLPQGTIAVRDLSAFQLIRVNQDTIKAELKPGWNSWQADYSSKRFFSAAPSSADLHVGQTYKQDMEKLVSILNISAGDAEASIRKVEDFFRENFKYSLYQNRSYPRGKYLSRFLFDWRAGHCEYFATATTLLLREAGIPARYMVGYVVDEFSPFEQQYVVRARHAHSWTMAYVNDKWLPIDTTPSVWADLEEEQASPLHWITDLWSWARLTSDRLMRHPLLAAFDKQVILILLVVVLFLKIFWRKRHGAMFIHDHAEDQASPALGQDSPFYPYIERLEAAGYKRQQHETLRHWLSRLSKEFPDLYQEELVLAHYDYRFNRNSSVSREEIRRMVIEKLPDPSKLN